MLGVCDEGGETDLGELSFCSVWLALNDVTSNQQASPQLLLGSQNCAGHQGTPVCKKQPDPLGTHTQFGGGLQMHIIS